MGLFVKGYGVSAKIKKAVLFRGGELERGLDRLNSFEEFYLQKSLELDNLLKIEIDKYNDLRVNVRKRFWQNIFRAFRGGDLHQDEEAQIGVRYDYDGKFFFKLEDPKKYEDAVSLEKKVSEYKGGGSFFGGAVYTASFRDDCFSNVLAKISTYFKGPVKGVADVLAGYVSCISGVRVAPHERRWVSRVSALENIILSNNFSSKDKKALLEVKRALASNKYLVKRRKEEYVRAVSLIDKAIERGSYEVR